MLGWRINSALFIDYENVSHRSLPDTIPNWLAWLEDGEFDDNKKRRLLEKRVYWNTTAEQHREKFEKFEFTAVLCEKFAKLKNGADIRMALDIFEATINNPKIKEFILITRDSDFIPVLDCRQNQSGQWYCSMSKNRKCTRRTVIKQISSSLLGYSGKPLPTKNPCAV